MTLPELRARPRDLRAYLNSMAEPLRVLKSINAAPGHDWSFTLMKPTTDGLVLEVEVPAKVCPVDLLDGTRPELHWCSSIELACCGMEAKITDPLAPTLSGVAPGAPDLRRLRLNNFAGRPDVPKGLWDYKSVADLLQRWTWLGSSSFLGSGGTVEWQVLADRQRFSAEGLAEKATEVDLQRHLYGPGFSARLISSARARGVKVRHAVFGELPWGDLTEPLQEALRSVGLKAATIELQGDWPVETGPLGQWMWAARMRPQLAALADLIAEDLRIRTFVEGVGEREMQRQARALSRRIEQARRAPRLRWRDRLVGTVPTSEQGTVALIHKLEGLGALPLAKFDSRAWAGHEGIDAIVDLQWDPVEPVQLDCPVEYEYSFDSFITHKHPVGHVRLIICWTAKARRDLEPQRHPWMRLYKAGTHAVPVLVLSEIPDLKVEA